MIINSRKNKTEQTEQQFSSISSDTMFPAFNLHGGIMKKILIALAAAVILTAAASCGKDLTNEDIIGLWDCEQWNYTNNSVSTEETEYGPITADFNEDGNVYINFPESGQELTWKIKESVTVEISNADGTEIIDFKMIKNKLSCETKIEEVEYKIVLVKRK